MGESLLTKDELVSKIEKLHGLYFDQLHPRDTKSMTSPVSIARATDFQVALSTVPFHLLQSHHPSGLYSQIIGLLGFTSSAHSVRRLRRPFHPGFDGLPTPEMAFEAAAEREIWTDLWSLTMNAVHADIRSVDVNSRMVSSPKLIILSHGDLREK